LQASFFFLKFL